MQRLALLLSVTFVAAGCGDDSKGGGGGGGGSPMGATCLFAADSCFVASGVTFTPTDLTNLGTACTGGLPAGAFTPSGTCSTASTVTGYCQYPDTSVAGVVVPGATLRGYFYAPAHDATSAGLACTTDGGTWTGGAPASVCGNGTVTGSEVCDGANLNGKTCATQGFTGGTLSCAANCLSFNTSACTGGGSTTVRCDYPGDMCEEYAGTFTAGDISGIQVYCSNAAGVYAAAACSRTGILSGHCNLGAAPVGTGTYNWFFNSTIWTQSEASTFCGMVSGTWVP